MTTSKISGRPASRILRVEELDALLDEPLETPDPVLDSLVTAAAKGHAHRELWDKLHASASRDDKLAELAFAYEHLAQDRRIKLVAAEHQAEVFLHAVRFFADVFGDADGAIAYAERALTSVPGHPEAVRRLEGLLEQSGDMLRLAKLHADLASSEADQGAQATRLRSALVLLDGVEGSDDLAIDIAHRVLRLDPAAADIRIALEARLMAAGKPKEAIKVLEQALLRDPPPGDDEALPIRQRLVELYAYETKEPHRAVPHLEAILAVNPQHPLSLQVAESLLENRAVAGRAAAALSDAYEKLGQSDKAGEMLNMELKLARGPRRMEVQRRLAMRRRDQGDPAGALELLGPVVAADPSDDEVRQAFVELSIALEQPLEAARLLSRALATAKDPIVRARVGAEIGTVYLRTGEVKRAEAAFQQVVEAGEDDRAMLIAGRHLAELHAESGDLRALAGALEISARLETNTELRHAAARRLAKLAEGELDDTARAISAWSALVDSPWADEALKRLTALYEASGDAEKLGDVLERRAQREKDPEQARLLSFKSAELRTSVGRDRGAALAAWRGLLAQYGPSREAHARMVPLLEQEKQWQELVWVLGKDIELAPPEERVALLTRLAQLQLTRIESVSAALDAYRRALELDSADKNVRAALDKLLAVDEARAGAAALLEPVYRAEGPSAGLLRVLESRARLAEAQSDRLAALSEAIEVAAAIGEPERALEFAGQGLRAVVDGDLAAVDDWIVRAESLGEAAGSATKRAKVLVDALGERPVDSPELSRLARAAGDALVTSGELKLAVDVFRRALTYEPSSSDLLQRIDDLLAQQGNPTERLALYQSALERPSDPARRREILHAMAQLQAGELGAPEQAVATLSVALEEDPKDFAAHRALVDIHRDSRDWRRLYAELERALALQDGERRENTVLEMAEVAAESGDAPRALAHYRSLLESRELSDEQLENIELLANANADAETLRVVLEKRVAAAPPEDRALLFEKLGLVLAKQLDDAEGAAKAWLEGARLSEAAMDDERARRLYERVLGVRPDDIEAARRLVELYARAGEWQKVPEPFALLASAGTTDPDPASLLLSLEQSAIQGGRLDVFVTLIDHVLEAGSSRRRQLLLTKARLLGNGPTHRDVVAGIYRTLLEEDADDSPAVADAFAVFLAAGELTAARIEDRRWLFEWRSRHAADPTAVLTAWAAAEENTFGSPERAADVYRRVLEHEPDRLDALTHLARLQASAGDAEGALATLTQLREKSEGADLSSIELAMARLMLGELSRAEEALSLVEAVLDRAPGDPDALELVRSALAHEHARPKAAALLGRLVDSAESPEAKVDVLESLLAVSEGLAELAERRGEWFSQLVDAKSDDDEGLLLVALRGAAERPGDGELWDAAERAARRLNRPGPLADAYSDALDGELDAELAEELGRRMVEFTEEWFDDPDRVVRLLARVLELSPDASWAFDRLKLAFNAAARWSDLFALYDAALARAADDALRIELLREASMAAKDFAADAERAIAYLEQLDALAPGDARIEAALERLYEREGRAEPLIGLLSRRLKTAKGSTKRELLARIASLWLDAFEPIFAFELVQQMLADGAPHEEVRELLERLVALPAARESMIDMSEGKARKKRTKTLSVRHAAAELLKAQYQESGSMQDVARMLDVELELASSTEERIARLEEIVALKLDELEDSVGAFEYVAQLLALEPAEKEHRASLSRLAQETNAHERLAEILTSVADGCGDKKVRVALVAEAAEVRQRALGDAAGAIALYGEVLAAAELDAEAALAAARQLDGLLDAAGRAEDRCAVLEQLAELETEPARRRAALGAAAALAFGPLSDFDRAARAWRARLTDREDDAEALDGLVEALAAAARHADLVEVLGRRARKATDPAAARADRVRIARLRAGELADTPGAIEDWRAIERDLGPDRESFDELSQLLGREQRYDELAEVVLGEAEREPDPERARSLFVRLATVHREHTGDLLGAVEALVRAGAWTDAMEVASSVARDFPGSSPTDDRQQSRRLVETLFERSIAAWQTEGDTGPVAAARWCIEELATKLAQAGAHGEVVALLVRAAELPFERAERRTYLREAACIASDRVEDADRAIGLMERLFADDPADEVAQATVTRLAKLYEQKGDYGKLVGLWEQQAGTRADGGDHAAAALLWARAAELAEAHLNDTERAVHDHRAGAALGGEPSLEALARIHEQGGDWLDAAAVLEWLCAQSPREALAPRALRLADAYFKAEEIDFARARLEWASIAALDAGAVRQRLAELYRSEEEWAPLAALLAADAERASDTKTRLRLLREAAQLHVTKRGDPALAVPLLEQAAELAPDEPSVRLALADALSRAGRFEDATVALRVQIERYGTRRPKDRALVHFALARVSLAAGRRAEAIAELDAANKINPAHPGILQALARLAFEEDQLDRSERMYRALLLVIGRDDDDDGPSRAEALLDLSAIATRLDDDSRAGEFVESAFEAALENPREAAALEAALRDRERYDLLARAVRGRLERCAEPAEAARALADLAFLHAERLGGLSEVSNKLRERARAIHEDLEGAASKDDKAWSALGRVYDFLGDPAAEAEVLERRVAGWTKSRASKEGAEPLYRLAEVRLSDPETRDRGIEVLERALELAPDLERAEKLIRQIMTTVADDARVVELFESIARASGKADLLAEALLASVQLPGAHAPQVREGLELAERLGDPELSRRLLEAGLERGGDELDADDASFMRLRLAAHLEEAGELARALDLQEQAAEHAEPDEQRRLRMNVARRAATDLGDGERAARIYEGLLEGDPAEREVWEPLLDVYRGRGDTERLVALIEQTVPLVDSLDDRARLRLEQASIVLDGGAEDDAATLLREILEEDPGQERAAELLGGILERQGRGDELIGLMVTQVDTAKDRQDVGRVVSFSLRLGKLLESKDRADDAFDVYYAVLDWERKNADVWRAVLRLSEAKEDPFLVAEALEGLLEVARGDEALTLAQRLITSREEQGDDEGRERALELAFIAAPSVAEIREPLLARCMEQNDHGRAARLLRRAVEAGANDRELISRLVEVHRMAAEQSAALELLDGLVQEESDGELARARALLLDDLDRPEEALEALDSARAAGVDVTAEMVSALERAILRAEPPRDRELSLRMVALLHESGDEAGARARLAEMSREDPKDREVVARLAELESAAENWDGAITALRKLLAISDAEELIQVALRLADACERGGRFGDARGGLERALEAAPHDRTLRERLRALYEATGEYRSLARLILEEAAVEQQVAARHALLLHAGTLLLAIEDGAMEAAGILEEARGLMPESIEGVVLLARALSNQGRSQEGMSLLNEVAAAQRGRRVKELCGVYHEMSRLQLAEGLLDDALQSLQKAFEMDMKNARVALELGQLAMDMENQELASRALRAVTLLRSSDDGEGATNEERAEAQYRLAWMAQHAGDFRKAKVLVAKALSESPEHAAALELQVWLETTG